MKKQNNNNNFNNNSSNSFDFSSLFSNFSPKQNNSNTVDEDKIKQDIDQYSNMSQDELSNTFYNTVSNEMASGNLSKEKLLNIKQTLFPMLNDEQRKNLENVLNPILKD